MDDFGGGKGRFDQYLWVPRTGVPEEGASDGMPLAGVGEEAAERAVAVAAQCVGFRGKERHDRRGGGDVGFPVSLRAPVTPL